MVWYGSTLLQRSLPGGGGLMMRGRRKDQQEDLWVVTEFYPWPWVSMGIHINGNITLGKNFIESFG